MRVVRDGGGILVFVMLMLMMFNTNCCRAAVLIKEKSNGSFRCSGHLDDCLIAEDMELELLMDSYINRMLIDGIKKPVTDIPKNAKTTPKPCGNGHQYGPCMGDKKVPANCGAYTRGCH
ncbi:hypothetical protein REPUB_Repub09cG0059400 [Reevesia pubescens]